jgi:hypothetical protein
VNGENLWLDRVEIVNVVAWPGCVGSVYCCEGEQDGQATVAHNQYISFSQWFFRIVYLGHSVTNSTLAFSKLIPKPCYKQFTGIFKIDTEMTCYRRYTGVLKIDKY